MRTLLFLIAGCCLSALTDNGQEFRQRLLEAEQYCFEISAETDSIAAGYDLTAAEILPVVYPECARYSQLIDKAESTVLEYYYIHGGTAAADFSVGHFQMKPGFAEALEERLTADERLSGFRKTFAYNGENVRVVREERLNRLLNEHWQIRYLCLYYRIMQLDYSRQFVDPEERTAYFAAAYNYGFMRSENEIRSWRHTTAFPNGQGNAGNYNYADLAVMMNRKMRSYENR